MSAVGIDMSGVVHTLRFSPLSPVNPRIDAGPPACHKPYLEKSITRFLAGEMGPNDAVERLEVSDHLNIC